MYTDDELHADEAVKPLMALLTSDRDLVPETIRAFTDSFGRCDFQGMLRPFAHTSYYEEEMGPDLWRCMVSFERLRPGWEAPRFKEWARIVERHFAVRGKRRVNCDPGFVDHLKMVLVSGKYGGHKVLMAPGVWVDMLMWYNKGWQGFPWSFPDFRDGTYTEDLTAIRKIFKDQLADRVSST